MRPVLLAATLLLHLLLARAATAEPSRMVLQVLNGSHRPVDVWCLETPDEHIFNEELPPGEQTFLQTTLGDQPLLVGKEEHVEREVISTVPVQAVGFAAPDTASRTPIPDKLVVLTFDDSAKSHATIAAPLLKKYGFGATFFITEGFDFHDNKRDYMTWDEIRGLHDAGFEIGNHTRDHLGITDATVGRLEEQLAGIAEQCASHGIPKPVTFAWPGNATTPEAYDVLAKHGILFARRGGAPEHPYETGAGFAFEPGRDHPLLLPSAGDARPDWSLENFVRAVKQARDGRIAIVQFHGVPDTAHDWVSSSRPNFEAYLRFLHTEGYQVIALRDLTDYVDPQAVPDDPQRVISERLESLGRSR